MQKEHSAQFAADICAAIKAAADSDRVYWNNAPEKDKVYPYIVFSIRSLEGDKIITLDFWGQKDGEIVLSDLSDTVEAELDGLVISNEYHASLLATNNNKQWIADEDERLIHLNMSFDATYQA